MRYSSVPFHSLNISQTWSHRVGPLLPIHFRVRLDFFYRTLGSTLTSFVHSLLLLLFSASSAFTRTYFVSPGLSEFWMADFRMKDRFVRATTPHRRPIQMGLSLPAGPLSYFHSRQLCKYQQNKAHFVSYDHFECLEYMKSPEITPPVQRKRACLARLRYLVAQHLGRTTVCLGPP